MSGSHSYIDSGTTMIAIYFASIAYGVSTVIHWIACFVAIFAGMLTILNMLGYQPKWLKSIKKYLKKISHE